MSLTTQDDFDDFLDRPKDPHQCWHYVDRTTRCTNETVENDYHCPEHRLKPAPIYRFPEDGFMLPDLVDRDSVLRAISLIAERLGQNALDPKRAGRLLYACQLANSALDGKLREQQLAFKQQQADQKRQAAEAKRRRAERKHRPPSANGTQNAPEQGEGAPLLHSIPPSTPEFPTTIPESTPPNTVILSGAPTGAQSKDPEELEPTPAAQTVQPQTPEPNATNNLQPVTANLPLGPFACAP